MYPSLQRLGFNTSLDPRTSNMSGEFENITFHIPNPEVKESFETSIPYAEEIGADLLFNSDPDADRIGVMARHEGKFEAFDGNQIATLLAYYLCKKKKGSASKKYIIKTQVTTSLVSTIAHAHGVEMIDGLMVGFKYI